jgi:hypothetical protein
MSGFPSPLVSTTAWLLLSASVLWGCGTGSTVDLAKQQAAIEGGELDESSTSVFRVLTRASGFEELCSATLIAPQLMLTARHCIAETNTGSVDCSVDRFGKVIPISEIKFSNATEPDLFSTWFDAVHIMTSDESDFTCGYDIAVIILEEPVPRSVAVPAEPRFAPQILTGEVYTAVGYGASNANEELADFGIRHSRGGLSVECGQDRMCESFVTAREFIGAGGACHGDSGGPAFDADGRVIGVLSRGAEGCDSPVYTGVPPYAALLTAAAQRAQTTFGVALPVWAGGVPIAEEPDAEHGAEHPVEAFTGLEADGGERGDEGGDKDNRELREQAGCTLSRSVWGATPRFTQLWAAGLAGTLLLVGRRRRR